MTDYTKPIEQLRSGKVSYYEGRSADAIETLQAECASLKQIAELNAQIAIDLKAERDALQSQLDAMGKGEPVGYVGAGYLTLGDGRISEHATEVYKVPVYAAPKALAPLERVAECAARLVEHADFQLGGILSADSKAKDIPSKAVSQVKSRHLAALRDSLAAHGIGGTP